MNILKGGHFTDGAKNAKFKPHPILMLLLFVVVFFTVQSVQSIPVSVVLIPKIAEIMNNLPRGASFTEIMEAAMSVFSEGDSLITSVNLLSTAITAAFVIMYVRLVEVRSLESMGLKKTGCVRHYLIGAAMGIVMYSAAVGICAAAGAAKYAGTDFNSPLMFVLICVGWLIQGAEEEILCRGWLMPSLSARMPLWAAVLINSLFFSLLHIMNAGFNLIVLVNLTLFGVCLSLVAIRFDSIIPCCALHSLWNLSQGNIFGMPVSGMATGPSVFRFTLADNMELWTGGAFGIEGGLGETIVVAAAIAAVVFIPPVGKSKKCGIGLNTHQ